MTHYTESGTDWKIDCRHGAYPVLWASLFHVMNLVSNIPRTIQSLQGYSVIYIASCRPALFQIHQIFKETTSHCHPIIRRRALSSKASEIVLWEWSSHSCRYSLVTSLESLNGPLTNHRAYRPSQIPRFHNF
jgi:hypothetical protein